MQEKTGNLEAYGTGNNETNFKMYSYVKIIHIDVKYIPLFIVFKIFCCRYLMLLLLFVCYLYLILKLKHDALI